MVKRQITDSILFIGLCLIIAFLLLAIFHQLGVLHDALTVFAVLCVIVAVIMIVRVIYKHKKHEEPPEDFLSLVLVSDPTFATYHTGLEGISFSESHRVEAWEMAKGRCENVVMGKRCTHRTFLNKPSLKHVSDVFELIKMIIKNVVVYHQLEFFYANTHHDTVPKDYGGVAVTSNRKHFCHVCNIRLGNSFTMEGLEKIWQRGETVCLSPGAKVYIDGVPAMIWTENGFIGIYD